MARRTGSLIDAVVEQYPSWIKYWVMTPGRNGFADYTFLIARLSMNDFARLSGQIRLAARAKHGQDGYSVRFVEEKP